MEKLDPETQKVFTEGDHLKALLKSEGWGIFQSKLAGKLRDLNSLSTTIFENKTADQISIELQARASAVVIITDLIADIIGTAEQAEANQTALQEDNEYIFRQ